MNKSSNKILLKLPKKINIFNNSTKDNLLQEYIEKENKSINSERYSNPNEFRKVKIHLNKEIMKNQKDEHEANLNSKLQNQNSINDEKSLDESYILPSNNQLNFNEGIIYNENNVIMKIPRIFDNSIYQNKSKCKSKSKSKGKKRIDPYSKSNNKYQSEQKTTFKKNLIEYLYKDNANLNKDLNEIYNLEHQLLFSNSEKMSDMSKKVIHFHSDPYHFLDILVEKYFNHYLDYINSNFSKHDNIHEKNKKSDFKTFMDKVIINENKMTIKKEDSKISEKEISYQQVDDKVKNQDLNTIENNASRENEFYSEPIKNDDIIKFFFSNKNKFYNNYDKVVESNDDIFKYCLNHPKTNLNYSRLSEEVLHCLKGNIIEPPKRRFIKVNEKYESKETKETKHLLDMQRLFNNISSNGENRILEEFKDNLNQENKIFNEYFESTKDMMNKVDKEMINSENLMEKILKKLDHQFEERMVKRGLDELQLVNTKLGDIKNEILKEDQYIEFNKERLDLNLDQTRNINRKVQMFLNEEDKNPNFNNENNTDMMNIYPESKILKKSVDINDSELEMLYIEYENYLEVYKNEKSNSKSKSKTNTKSGFRNKSNGFSYNSKSNPKLKKGWKISKAYESIYHNLECIVPDKSKQKNIHIRNLYKNSNMPNKKQKS